MIDNIFIIKGRLTRDPDYTPANGEKKQYCKFSVAVSRHRGDEADFVDCIIFGKRADVIREFFSKGKEIRVIGSHQCEKYTDKNGNTRKHWTLFVDDFGFSGSKSDNITGGSDALSGANGFEEVEADIPF